MKLNDFKVLTFDCYGTLIDWETGIMNALSPLTDRLRLSLTQDEILEKHARYEFLQEMQTPFKPYRDVLSIIYRRLAEEWNIGVSLEECRRYGSSIKNWPVFPDTVEALKYLKQHYKLVILSNVDNESFAETNKVLGVNFDAIYTAEDIGNYKPSDVNFTYMINMLRTLGFEKRDIIHTAESLFHDHAPANRHGLNSCWIYRRSNKEGFGATMAPEKMPHYDFRFSSMAEMAEEHKKNS